MGAKLMTTRPMADSLPSSDQKARWDRVRERLRNEVGEAAFNSWLRPVELLDASGRTVRLSVPTRFMRDWVVKNYADRIRTLWQGEDQGCDAVEILVAAATLPVLSTSGSAAPMST